MIKMVDMTSNFEKAKESIKETSVGVDIVSSEVAKKFGIKKQVIDFHLKRQVELDELLVRYVLTCPRCNTYIKGLVSNGVGKLYPFTGTSKCGSCGYIVDKVEGHKNVDLVFRVKSK